MRPGTVVAPIVVSVLSLAGVTDAQVVLEQQTLGTGVGEIDHSRLDLDVRNTYEVDGADLDADGDTDLVYGQFILFNPDILAPGATQPFLAVRGSGGLRLLFNRSNGSGQVPDAIAGPPNPDGIPSAHYDYIKGNLVDETAARLQWAPGAEPPSVRDMEIADLDGDGLLDIVLACSVAVDPGHVVLPPTNPPTPYVPEQDLTQNRILKQFAGGIFRDDTFGADGVQGGTGVDQDRLPLRASNTCGVAVGDVNGDCFVDIVFAEYGPYFTGDTNVLLLNDGAGHFSPPATGNPFAGFARASVDVELGDLDGDTDLDIVFANANPLRASVMNTTVLPWALVPALADVRREEIWINQTPACPVGGPLTLQFLQPPDPPGLPESGATLPYNDPGFWSDTRSVAIGDIDGDNDGDILFANNGWATSPPDERNNTIQWASIFQWSPEHHGQPPQLLLNMGGNQAGEVPKVPSGTMGLNDFLDVGYYALPWARGDFMRVADPGGGSHVVLNPDGCTLSNPKGKARVGSDVELTPGVVGGVDRDIGSPVDLLDPVPVNPTRDGFPDLLFVRGASASPDVLINSGDHQVDLFPDSPTEPPADPDEEPWDMRVTSDGRWYTIGRFYRGDTKLLSDWWADPPTNDPCTPNVLGRGARSLWLQQESQPRDFPQVRFGFWFPSTLYASDGDWFDLDSDGWLDVATANSEPSHGQINTVFLFRTLQQGMRWAGPSDEGAILPYVSTVLAYGVSSGDVDADGDVDIVVAGVPTALMLLNRKGESSGSGTTFAEGFFREATFQDRGGLLPFTGQAPLYAPLLAETVGLFDAEGDGGPLEMMFCGYPPYDSQGNAYQFTNEAEQWHLYDVDYFRAAVPSLPSDTDSKLPHCTFYVGVDSSGVYQDRTLAVDTAPDPDVPWLDRNGRIYENVSDEVRGADLDNDGDQDMVVAYRDFDRNAHPDQNFGVPWGEVIHVDPALYQVVLSLWMNDGAGHLTDRAAQLLGPAGAGANDYPWFALAGDRYEGLAFADVDSDGDLDMLATSTLETEEPGDNGVDPTLPASRLFINMGGLQKNADAGPYRAGHFRVAGLAGGPSQIVGWGGDFDSDLPNIAGLEVESADLNADDWPDFAVAGYHREGAGPTLSSYLLVNNGDGTFHNTDYNGIQLDGWINHAPNAGDATFSVEPGDFDGDGKLDLAFVNSAGHTPRLLRNVTVGTQIDPTFDDLTSFGNAATVGSGDPDGISWLAGWGVDGAVDDFDGNGVHDLYLANHDRTTQDELLLSTVSKGASPWVTGVTPGTGQTTGRLLRIRGVNLQATTTVTFERVGTAPVPVTVSGSQVSAREVQVVVPTSVQPGAQFGLGRISLTPNGGTTVAYQFTHLNAAPVLTEYAVIGSFGFDAVDADGVAHIDTSSWKIERIRLGNVTTWTAASPGSWTLTTLSSSVRLTAPNSVKAIGDTFLYEIGDASAGFGYLKKKFGIQ